MANLVRIRWKRGEGELTQLILKKDQQLTLDATLFIDLVFETIFLIKSKYQRAISLDLKNNVIYAIFSILFLVCEIPVAITLQGFSFKRKFKIDKS